MFIDLKHKKLAVYAPIRELVCEVYKVASLLPPTEKFNLVQQVQRAALSVKHTFAEGASRKSVIERKRYFEIARGSLLNKCFAMITGSINSVEKQA